MLTVSAMLTEWKSRSWEFHKVDTCLRGVSPMVWASSATVDSGAQSFSLSLQTVYLLLTPTSFHFLIGRDKMKIALLGAALMYNTIQVPEGAPSSVLIVIRPFVDLLI